MKADALLHVLHVYFVYPAYLHIFIYSSPRTPATLTFDLLSPVIFWSDPGYALVKGVGYNDFVFKIKSNLIWDTLI